MIEARILIDLYGGVLLCGSAQLNIRVQRIRYSGEVPFHVEEDQDESEVVIEARTGKDWQINLSRLLD